MEDLKRLVRIISKRKQRQYPLLELKSINENSSKENIFFRYIKRGAVNTDDEASKLIYGTKSDDDRYRMLKSRLKQKLLNHMFFLEFTDFNQKSSAQFEQECIQQLHQSKMLIFTGENKIAKSLAIKALTSAERYEFTKYSLSSLEYLVKIYSDNCQPHLFDDIVKKLRITRDLFQLEEETREQYYFIKMMIVKSVNSRKKNIENAVEVIERFKKLWSKTKSFNIFEYLYQLIVLHKELTGDFNGIIPILQEIQAGSFMGISLNIYRLEKIKIIQSMSFAYLKAWEFEKGIKYVKDNLEYFEESTSEWYAIYETYFLLNLHNKNYKEALSIIDYVFDNKTFDKLLDEDKEKWKLFNAYLHLVFTGNFFMRNLNFKKIVESVPEYDKEKEGFNAAVLVLQFLFFIEQRQLDELIKRRDVLKGYMANHFKENFSYRSRTMYKLINIVVESKLDLKLIMQKSRYLTKKLDENKIVGSAYTELEIVPYEHIWELIVNMLRYHERRGF